jgi:RNA polymerase subunit RPABC4/transcription elongation factor Spt4
MRKKICKRCKAIVEGTKCPDPECNGVQNGQLAQSYKGRMYIVDANKSDIAKKVGLKYAGEYAIKVS